MKVLNRNNSSIKTRRLIKNTFIQMLSEKREIGKISVSELVARAEISRATFYAHFDDIYCVVEEFETELINEFFTNAKLLATDNYEKFFETLFAFLKENDENYKMMCKSNDVLFSAKRLTTLNGNKRFSGRDHLRVCQILPQFNFGHSRRLVCLFQGVVQKIYERALRIK